MPSPETDPSPRPTIGVLKLETRFERFLGDIGNPHSLPYPVLIEEVAGASAEKVTSLDDDSLLAPFIAAGRRLVDRGADAITTTCGFLVLYQQELAVALSVPVATSSLLQSRSPRRCFPRAGPSASSPSALRASGRSCSRPPAHPPARPSPASIQRAPWSRTSSVAAPQA